MSLNKVILIGRVGKKPEIRYTPQGSAVSNFNIATSEKWTDKSGKKQDRTEWHKIVAWGNTAELCDRYLDKGRQVYIEGKIQSREWSDKQGQTHQSTEIHAQSIVFLGGKETNPEQEDLMGTKVFPIRQQPPKQEEFENFENFETVDDLPF